MPLNQEERIKYKSLYLKAARAYIKELEVNLNYLQEGKDSTEVTASLHRAAHSLASQGTMMSFQSITAVTSQMEKIFETKRTNEYTFSQEELTKLIEATKHLFVCLDEIEKTNQESDLKQDIENLQSFTKIIA